MATPTHSGLQAAMAEIAARSLAEKQNLAKHILDQNSLLGSLQYPPPKPPTIPTICGIRCDQVGLQRASDRELSDVQTAAIHILQTGNLPPADLNAVQRAMHDALNEIARRRQPNAVLSTGSTPAKTPTLYKIDPIEWRNKMPEMTDPARDNATTPEGAIMLRLNAYRMPDPSRFGGDILPNIRHLSAHVVQRFDDNHFRLKEPEKAYVFIVTSDGTDVTLTEENPLLFPSDTLILSIRMLMDGAAK